MTVLGTWLTMSCYYRLGGIGRSQIEFNKFLRATKWQNPTDAAHTAMHASYNTDLANAFVYLGSVGLGPQINHHSKSLANGFSPGRG